MRIPELFRGIEWFPQNMHVLKRLQTSFFPGVVNASVKNCECRAYDLLAQMVGSWMAPVQQRVQVERRRRGRGCFAARSLL